MKSFTTHLKGRNRFAVVMVALMLVPQVFPRPASAAQSETGFPYVIPLEIGKSGFASGDEITITSVRGDRAHIEPGGNYLVQGHYTLASADAASLALFCTTHGPSGSTPISANQTTNLNRGSGDFSLSEVACDGWLHVSFYPRGNGSSRGGIYFGEKGVEKTILRQMSSFNQKLTKLTNSRVSVAEELNRAAQQPSPDATGLGKSSAAIALSRGHATYGPNHAIMQYLGSPVPAPADLDAKYNSQNLMAAFTAAAKDAQRNIKMIAVDNSEFPFLVYGVLEGRYDGGQAFTDALNQMEGYDYGGAVSGSTDSAATFFAYNITPREHYPQGSEEQCNRRLMVRLQMLAQKAREWEQLNAR
jgi:hypothetical protein